MSVADNGELGQVLLTLAVDMARRAGELIVAGRRTGVASLSTKSSTTDMVTEFDRASEQMIVGRLAAERPDDGVIGEEGTASAGTSGIDWLIDPIDGTTNFLYDLPGYAVSIAATDAGGALVGAVYVPAHDEMFAARRGAGATMNGAAIRCGERADLGQALIGTGFNYVAERRAVQAQRVAAIMPHVRDIRRLGAASVDLCYAAMGRLDAYFEEHLGPWDLAAGELIAREAGCITGDFHGGPAGASQVLVANPLLFTPLAQLLARA